MHLKIFIIGDRALDLGRAMTTHCEEAIVSTIHEQMDGDTVCLAGGKEGIGVIEDWLMAHSKGALCSHLLVVGDDTDLLTRVVDIRDELIDRGVRIRYITNVQLGRGLRHLRRRQVPLLDDLKVKQEWMEEVEAEQAKRDEIKRIVEEERTRRAEERAQARRSREETTLRMWRGGSAAEEIAEHLGIRRAVVLRYLRRAVVDGRIPTIKWPRSSRRKA